MGLTAGLLIGGVALGGAAEMFVGGRTMKDNQLQQATLPDSTKASQDASSTVANQRQILLASGGQTDYTGGTGVLTGSDVTKTTLLGG